MTEKKQWVDYRELKATVNFRDVLSRYGLLEKLKKSGQNLTGCCPVHGGSNDRQFSVNIDKGIYNCFGKCKGGGNVIDFVKNMERISFHEAALLLQGWFMNAPQEDNTQTSEEKAETSSNEPLTFELKNLDNKHPFFSERGIPKNIIREFGLGFCNKGLMSGRIVIPIRNRKGELVAYCGRAVTREQAELEGKYKFPEGFKKNAEIYNIHKIKDGAEKLILTESFMSVLRLARAGYRDVAALMGTNLAIEQKSLLRAVLSPSARVLIIADHDEPGLKARKQWTQELSEHFFVRAITPMPYAKKPHLLKDEDIKKLLRI